MALFRDVLFSNYCGQTQKRNGLKFGLIRAKFKLFALQAANAMSEHALTSISKIRLSGPPTAHLSCTHRPSQAPRVPFGREEWSNACPLPVLMIWSHI